MNILKIGVKCLLVKHKNIKILKFFIEQNTPIIYIVFAMKHGERLRRILKDRKMSQLDLADKLGVDKGTINRWVAAETLSNAKIMRICDALKINYMDFMMTEAQIAAHLQISENTFEICKQMDKLPLDKKEAIFRAINELLVMWYPEKPDSK